MGSGRIENYSGNRRPGDNYFRRSEADADVQFAFPSGSGSILAAASPGGAGGVGRMPRHGAEFASGLAARWRAHHVRPEQPISLPNIGCSGADFDRRWNHRSALVLLGRGASGAFMALQASAAFEQVGTTRFAAQIMGDCRARDFSSLL